ncbi:hypothetical protein ACO2I3_12390 [Leptospira interrogans]
MAVDNRTESRDYALPDGTNDLSEDVTRLIAALEAIDVDVAALLLAVAGKAALAHGHSIEEITGLVSALASKAASSHTHSLDDLSDVSIAGASNGQFVKKVGESWSPATLAISDVSGLQDALNDSTLPEHEHEIGEIEGLEAALAAKASISHGHAIAAISGLQDALDAKTPTSRTVSTSGLASGGGDLSANRTITVPKAAAAEMRAGTDDAKALTAKAAFDAMDEVELTYSGTITIDLASGRDFFLTMTGSPTFANPTGGVKGMRGRIRLINDATGGRVPSYGTAWKFVGDVAPSGSTGANVEDFLDYEVVASGRIRAALTKDVPT